MDEISQGPEGGHRPFPKPPRWLAAAAIAGVVAVAAMLAVTRGGEPRPAAAPPPTSSPPTSSPSGVSTPAPTAGLFFSQPYPMSSAQIVSLPGALSPTSQLVIQMGPQGQVAVHSSLAPAPLLGCESASAERLGTDWQAGSLRVGPLWFVDGTRLGYVRLSRGAPAGGEAPGRPAHMVTVRMLVHVDTGSVVLMRIVAGGGSYFRLLNGNGHPLAADDEVILPSCPAGASQSGGSAGFYRLGFSIAPGHTASVAVWSLTNATSPRTVWVTFAAPGERK